MSLLNHNNGKHSKYIVKCTKGFLWALKNALDVIPFLWKNVETENNNSRADGKIMLWIGGQCVLS